VKAQSVLGPVAESKLGLTLFHEHLLFDFMVCLMAPKTPKEQIMADHSLAPETRGALRFNPCLVPDNLLHTDIELAIEEVKAFTEVGGSTIVDPTNVSIGRDPEGLKKIAEATGLNIIMGAGYYYQIAFLENFTARSEKDIEAEIINDITVGVADTGICAGLIGEIGSSSPITADEEKSLRAAARAQAATGAPLMIHLDGWQREGNRVLDLIEDAGGDVTRTVLCHLNPAWFDIEYQISLLDRGAVLEFDMFGNDHYYPGNDFVSINRAAPDELVALKAMAKLIERGYVEQLLISQDVYLKMMLCKYGGYGYAHLFNNLPPYFKEAGITQASRDVMMIENPRRLLAFLP